MADFPFYSCDSPQYAADFQVLLRGYNERPGSVPLLDEIVAGYGPDAVVVDWGAGSGDLTRWLLERFEVVHAVEPSPILREMLARACPRARVIAGTIAGAAVPDGVDLGFLRHVLYHVPDHKWGAYVLRAAARLSGRGVLVVVLKHPGTACNAMLEHFGARRFDLTTIDADLLGAGLRVERVTVSGRLTTGTFEETYAAARFLLNDREPDAYARTFTEEEVRSYVRAHLWDEERRRGGWPYPVLYYLIRRNRFWEEERGENGRAPG